MNLTEKFKVASANVQKLDEKPSNNDLLDLYSLFKAANDGPAHGKRPGVLKMVARAKFDAWNKLGQITKDVAMQQYIIKVEKLQE